jgi:crossover junction endodeoxyribonuclease RuvC
MRVLGVDPGTLCTGWGLVERSGNRIRGVAAGIVKPKKSETLPLRLRTIHQRLAEVIGEHDPGAVAVEDLFHAKYARSALKLGHARGVILLAAAQAEIEVFAYPPALVKRTVAGRGAADKAQIAQLVGVMLGWKELPAEDATDALAVAITHAQASMVTGRLATGK